MNISIFSENTWLYPDTTHTSCQKAVLNASRNSYVGFQLLGDPLDNLTTVSMDITWEKANLIESAFYELLPIGVDENTDSDLMTTLDYSRCKDFVTRQAPFWVYDGLKPLAQDHRTSQRLALFIEFHIPAEATPGHYLGDLKLQLNDEIIHIPIECMVTRALIPNLKDSSLGVMNFFSFANVASQHNVSLYSEAYWDMFRVYVRSQLGMRCTHIMLPGAIPIYNDKKEVVDFDFTHVTRAAEIALEEDAPYIVGAAIASWVNWDDTSYHLLWDKDIPAESLTGYYHLKTYFSKWAAIVAEKQWGDKIIQSLADEPQIHNDLSYRAIASVCRKFLPGITIIEAIETFDIGGGVDIWVPKQDTYEKHKETFDAIKAKGETMWFYTCAFPAGKIMNRSMDLPLLVSRYALWMGFSYDFTGFLHWGFNYYEGPDIFNQACCPHKGAKLPAGDAHIVYPGDRDVWMSMRYIQQRGGAQDFELFRQLEKTNPDLAHEIVSKGCTSFKDYTSDEETFLKAHKQLLESF